MKNINNLEPIEAVIFRKNKEQLILIKNETKVKIITDNTDFDKEYSGLIIFINEDAIEIDDGELINWEYVKEIIIIE